MFSNFLITLHLIIFHSSTFLLFNFVYSELPRASAYENAYKAYGKTNKLQADTHTYAERDLSLGFCFIFSLLSVPDRFLEI